MGIFSMATMPSASLVSSSNSNGNSTSNMSSTEVIGSPNDSALSLALQTLEKKVRNLEKRKGKLDGYREDDRKGKELLEDQKKGQKRGGGSSQSRNSTSCYHIDFSKN